MNIPTNSSDDARGDHHRHDVTPPPLKKNEIGHSGGDRDSENSKNKKRKYDDDDDDDDDDDGNREKDDHCVDGETNDQIIRPDVVVSYTDRGNGNDDDDDDLDEEEYEIQEGIFPTFVQLDHLLSTLCTARPLRKNKNDQDDSSILKKLHFLFERFQAVRSGNVSSITEGGANLTVQVLAFVEDFIALSGHLRLFVFIRRNMKDSNRLYVAAGVIIEFNNAYQRHRHQVTRPTVIEDMIDRRCLNVLVLAIEECVSAKEEGVWLKPRCDLWGAICGILTIADHSKIDFDDKLLVVAEAVVDYFRLPVSSSVNDGEFADLCNVEFRNVMILVLHLLEQQKTKMTRFCHNNGVCSIIFKNAQQRRWNRPNWLLHRAVDTTIHFCGICLQDGLVDPSDKHRLVYILADILEMYSAESDSRAERLLSIIGMVADGLPTSDDTDKTKIHLCNILLRIIQRSYKSNHDGESDRIRHTCQELLSKISPPSLLYE